MRNVGRPRARRAPFVGLHHLELAGPAGREADALRFFGEIVALPPIPKPAHLTVRGGVGFRIGAQELRIGPGFDKSRGAPSESLRL